MTDREIIAAAIAGIVPVDDDARAAALALQLQLTKPAGALGRLEELHVWAAGVRRTPLPEIGAKADRRRGGRSWRVGRERVSRRGDVRR